MHRILVTAALVIVPLTVFAQETNFENVITQAGYVHYMAEMACLSRKAESQTDTKEEMFSPEWLKKEKEKVRAIAEKTDQKYGLDKLSQAEKNRMVSHFKRQRDTNMLVMNRAQEISPSCDTLLPAHLAEIMSRDQFVTHMAELFCLKEKQPTRTAFPEPEKFVALSDKEKNMIADTYTLSPTIYVDIRARLKQLDGQCKNVSP